MEIPWFQVAYILQVELRTGLKTINHETSY